MHARAAAVSWCLARVSYTSLRHIPAISHLTSPRSRPIRFTPFDLTYIHLSIPPNPSRRYLPSALARLIASTLARPALRGPRITKLHVGITFRRATAIPWFIPPHSHVEFSSASLLYEWPAPPSPLEHEVVIRVPKVAYRGPCKTCPPTPTTMAHPIQQPSSPSRLWATTHPQHTLDLHYGVSTSHPAISIRFQARRPVPPAPSSHARLM